MKLNLYGQEITRAMTYLAEQSNTVFVGQSVKYDGQALFDTFSGVPMEKRIEMPVAEDFQMGFCIGLALQGYIPISFYPRFDFLLLAANQLVNHLDKIPLISGYRPKVIIRTAVGHTSPLDPGPQHTQDHTEAFRQMLNTVDIVTIDSHETAFDKYISVLANPNSVLVIEYMEKYR